MPDKVGEVLRLAGPLIDTAAGTIDRTDAPEELNGPTASIHFGVRCLDQHPGQAHFFFRLLFYRPDRQN
jgi:hypothetical protein